MSEQWVTLTRLQAASHLFHWLPSSDRLCYCSKVFCYTQTRSPAATSVTYVVCECVCKMNPSAKYSCDPVFPTCQVPERFIEVAEVALREFYSAIWTGRDSDPCWKKGIYKIICKLDSPVPDAFRLPGCPVGWCGPITMACCVWSHSKIHARKVTGRKGFVKTFDLNWPDQYVHFLFLIISINFGSLREVYIECRKGHTCFKG